MSIVTWLPAEHHRVDVRTTPPEKTAREVSRRAMSMTTTPFRLRPLQHARPAT